MTTQVEQETRRTRLLGAGRFRLDVEPCVYGTVLLMTVLAVALDDDAGIEDFAEASQLVLGPLLATFLAHLFAAVLAHLNTRHALPDARALLRLVAHAAQFLVLALPPLAVFALGAATGLYSAEDAVDHVLDLGLLLLVLLGGVGGWRAGGRRWWPALLGAVVAGLMAVVVVLLREVLE